MNIEKSGIYKISIASHFYIGSAVYLGNRKRQHLFRLRNKTHDNPFMQSCYDKYGEDSFKFELVEYCKPDNLIEREQHYIDTLNPDINIRKIADSNRGLKWTDEQRKRKSLIHKTEKHIEIAKQNLQCVNNLGRKHTEESKQKMSEAQKGKIITEEQIQKFKKTIQTSKKFKAGLDKIHNACKKPVLQYDLFGSLINKYDSLIEAQRQTGIDSGSIIRVCKCVRKTSGGYVWRYAV